jgi:hypothetical protein
METDQPGGLLAVHNVKEKLLKDSHFSYDFTIWQ